MNARGLSPHPCSFVNTALENDMYRVCGRPTLGVCLHLSPRPVFFPWCPGIPGCQPHMVQKGHNSSTRQERSVHCLPFRFELGHKPYQWRVALHAGQSPADQSYATYSPTDVLSALSGSWLCSNKAAQRVHGALGAKQALGHGSRHHSPRGPNPTLLMLDYITRSVLFLERSVQCSSTSIYRASGKN